VGQADPSDCVDPAGNKNGLLLPSTTTDQELLHTRNSLPEDVVVQRVDESALSPARPTSSTRFASRLQLQAVAGVQPLVLADSVSYHNCIWARTVGTRQLHCVQRLRSTGTHGYRQGACLAVAM
jgi:hypothetical protein